MMAKQPEFGQQKSHEPRYGSFHTPVKYGMYSCRVMFANLGKSWITFRSEASNPQKLFILLVFVSLDLSLSLLLEIRYLTYTHPILLCSLDN